MYVYSDFISQTQSKPFQANLSTKVDTVLFSCVGFKAENCKKWNKTTENTLLGVTVLPMP